MIEVGQVVTVWFPFSHMEAAPYKRRPVLVLGKIGSGADEAILVTMITSNARRVRSPHADDVPIPDHAACGLPLPSIVRATRIWTAQSRDVASTLGEVPPEVLDEVRTRIQPLFGL